MTIFFNTSAGSFVATDASSGRSHDLWHRFAKTRSLGQNFAGFLRANGHDAKQCGNPMRLLIPPINVCEN